MMESSLFISVIAAYVFLAQGLQIKFTSYPRDVIFVNTGSDLSLEITYKCDSGCENGAGVSWKKITTKGDTFGLIYRLTSGRLIQYDKRASLTDDIHLVYRNIKADDSGTYEVELAAAGYRPAPKRLIDVIVTKDPVINIRCNKALEIKENDAITCECSTSQGTVEHSTQWFNKHGRAVGADKILALKSIQAKQAGNYTCQVKGESFNMKKNITLKVTDVKISSEENCQTTATVEAGETVNKILVRKSCRKVIYITVPSGILLGVLLTLLVVKLCQCIRKARKKQNVYEDVKIVYGRNSSVQNNNKPSASFYDDLDAKTLDEINRYQALVDARQGESLPADGSYESMNPQIIDSNRLAGQ